MVKLLGQLRVCVTTKSGIIGTQLLISATFLLDLSKGVAVVVLNMHTCFVANLVENYFICFFLMNFRQILTKDSTVLFVTEPSSLHLN